MRFLGLFVLLTALFAVYRCVLARTLETRLQAIRDAGYPVSLDELDVWYPQAPSTGNSADVFGEAFTKLDFGRKPIAVPAVDLAERSPHAAPLSEPTKRAISSVLASNAEAIALLHDGASIKRSRYPVDLTHLSLLPYPHLINLQRSAYLLELEAVDYANDQNPELAVRSVRSLLGLADSLATEPLIRSHLARLDCQKNAVASLRNVLNRIALSDSDLGALSAALGRADNPQSLVRAFAGQRCIGIYGFDMMSGTMDVSRFPSGLTRPWSQRLLIDLNLAFVSPDFLYYPSGLVRWDEMRYLWFMDQYINAAQKEFPERIAAARTLEGDLKRLPGFCKFTRQWLQAMNGTRLVLRDAETVALLRAARVATAVERYRLAHNDPPETLASLMPDYLKTVPADPLNPVGGALRYKRLARGYVVYSAGVDGLGNGNDEKEITAFGVER